MLFSILIRGRYNQENNSVDFSPQIVVDLEILALPLLAALSDIYSAGLVLQVNQVYNSRRLFDSREHSR